VAIGVEMAQTSPLSAQPLKASEPIEEVSNCEVLLILPRSIFSKTAQFWKAPIPIEERVVLEEEVLNKTSFKFAQSWKALLPIEGLVDDSLQLVILVILAHP
jgi:hypothetical protein